VRLFCFPCAGASAATYASWAAVMPPEFEAFVLELPGRGGRFREPPVRDLVWLIREIAGAVRGLMDRPSVFFGHSLGALLSYELARELRRQGAIMPHWLYVAGRRAPQLPDLDPPIHGLPDDDFIAELALLGGIPDALIAERELLELLLPAMRADIFLNETYVYGEEEPLKCLITALGGQQDAEVPTEDLRAWSAQSSAGFELVMFEGGHFFVHPERAPILRLMNEFV